MDDSVAAAWGLLPHYLGEHVLLSAAAMGLGLVLSLLLTVAAVRSARVRWPVLVFASVVQTIPSLALLARFYPLLVALSSLTDRLFGIGFSALGVLPSLLALTLYSMLPVIRNGVTGVLNIDPAIIQAARNGVRIEGATVYVTASPCWGCFKMIANAGITRIVFGEFYRDERIFQFSERLGIALVGLGEAATSRTPPAAATSDAPPGPQK